MDFNFYHRFEKTSFVGNKDGYDMYVGYMLISGGYHQTLYAIVPEGEDSPEKGMKFLEHLEVFHRVQFVEPYRTEYMKEYGLVEKPEPEFERENG